MMRAPNTTALVVHRLPGVRRFVALALRLNGMETVEAEDGASALELVRTMQPTLVLAEAALPGLTGQELAAETAQLRPAPAVLLLSAYGRPPRGPEDGFLAEPFSLEELLEAVAPYLPSPATGADVPGLPQFA